MVEKIYRMLLRKYGRQNWWPVSGLFRPPEFEICIGAILTQNTNWKNVERALANLVKSDKVTAEKICAARLDFLEKLIRPSGFYRQKAKRLKEFSRFVASFSGDFYRHVTREQLLSINGIGKETADSILLYACNRPHFVIDAYTRRMLARLGLINGNEGYEELKRLFEASLPASADIYKEFHALIVEHEKRNSGNINTWDLKL